MTNSLVGLDIEQRHNVVVAHVTGELDIAGVPTSARGLVVDFSELEFIDSSGIAMLFALARQLGSRRQELRVVAPAGQPVARVLEIVEFTRAAPLDSDLDTAVAEVG